jgi:hypothetical protein
MGIENPSVTLKQTISRLDTHRQKRSGQFRLGGYHEFSYLKGSSIICSLAP